MVAKGDRGYEMYFIASGALEVRIEPEPIKLKTGEFFGELALLSPARRRNADVVALGFCRLLVLRHKDFTRLVAGTARSPSRSRRRPPPAPRRASGYIWSDSPHPEPLFKRMDKERCCSLQSLLSLHAEAGNRRWKVPSLAFSCRDGKLTAITMAGGVQTPWPYLLLFQCSPGHADRKRRPQPGKLPTMTGLNLRTPRWR